MKPLFWPFLLIVACSAQAQEFTINGTVRDDLNGESLIGATIFNPRSRQGATTNNYGLYSLTQTSDSVVLQISYVGYKPSSIKFLLTKDTTLNIGLSNGTLLLEIVIQETATDKIQESSRMGTIDVP
jgi:hypothetical protein